jgi:hypothetical protein
MSTSWSGARTCTSARLPATCKPPVRNLRFARFFPTEAPSRSPSFPSDYHAIPAGNEERRAIDGGYVENGVTPGPGDRVVMVEPHIALAMRVGSYDVDVYEDLRSSDRSNS